MNNLKLITVWYIWNLIMIWASLQSFWGHPCVCSAVAEWKDKKVPRIKLYKLIYRNNKNIVSDLTFEVQLHTNCGGLLKFPVWLYWFSLKVDCTGKSKHCKESIAMHRCRYRCTSIWKLVSCLCGATSLVLWELRTWKTKTSPG